MAEDLKVIPKQFLTQPVDLGQNNAFGRIQETLNKVSEFAAGKAEDMFVGEAKKKGESKALLNQGKPQKSAPGLTRATQAENEAYLSATAKLLTVKMNGLLLNNTQYVENNLQKLGPEAIPKLNTLNDSMMSGFMQQVPDEIKNDLEYQFILGKEKTMSHMMEQVSKFNNARAAESFTTTFTSDISNVTQRIFSGDAEGAKEANAAAIQTIEDYKTLGKLSPYEESQAREKLSFAISDSFAVSGFLRARAESPQAEAEYLYKAANDMPTGITREQWVSGQRAIGKEISRLGKLGNEHMAYIRADINNGIETGRISTESDLMPYKDKITASDYVEYTTKMLKKDSEGNKKQLDIDNYLALRATDPSKASLTSDNVRDAAFEQSLQPLLDEKIANTGNPNAKLTLREMVPMARLEPSRNRLFSTKLQDSIKSSDPEVSRDAILAYNDLNGSPGQLTRAKVLDIDAQSDQIAFSAISLARNANEPLDLAIEQSQKAIMLNTDTQRAANLDAYKNKFMNGKKGQINFAKSFLNASGVNIQDNGFASKVYSEIFTANATNMPNLEAAEALSNIQFRQSFMLSQYNENPKQIMHNAPELVVPKADMGRWLRNQEILNLYHQVKELETVPIAKANREKNLKRINEISVQVGSMPMTDASRKKLNDESEKLLRQLQLADYNDPPVKWIMGKLKDKYTEKELMNSDLFTEAARSRMSNTPSGMPSEEQSVSLLLGDLFTGNTRESRRPVVGIGATAAPTRIYLEESSETMGRSDGKHLYLNKYKNGIGAALPFPNPFNDSDNPEFKGNSTFLVRPFEEFLPNTAKLMNTKSMAQIDEKTQNSMFASENPLSFTGMLFDRQNTIADRFAKKQAFKKKVTQAKADEAKKEPPK